MTGTGLDVETQVAFLQKERPPDPGRSSRRLVGAVGVVGSSAEPLCAYCWALRRLGLP